MSGGRARRVLARGVTLGKVREVLRQHAEARAVDAIKDPAAVFLGADQPRLRQAAIRSMRACSTGLGTRVSPSAARS